MVFLPVFSNWAVGSINGYKYKEGGLPNNMKYGTMGAFSVYALMNVVSNFDTPNIRLSTGAKLGGLVIGVPLAVGLNFCFGHQLGKAVRYLKDTPDSVPQSVSTITKELN